MIVAVQLPRSPRHMAQSSYESTTWDEYLFRSDECLGQAQDIALQPDVAGQMPVACQFDGRRRSLDDRLKSVRSRTVSQSRRARTRPKSPRDEGA